MKLNQFVKLLLTGLVIWGLLNLDGCSTTHSFSRRDGAPHGDVDVSKIPDAIPRSEPRSKYGNPSTYVVGGVRYHVLSNAKGYDKIGLASWYGTKFHGQLTSSREPYNLFAMTAASCTLPIPTYVRVTNLRNGKSVIVKVNDRGPFKSNRLIDLSYAAAKKLGYAGQGTTQVRVTALDPAIWTKNSTAVPTTVASPIAQHTATHLASAVPEQAMIDTLEKIYMQVGAFSNLNNAERLKQRIQHLTKAPIAIHKTQHLHTAIYKVQIGPLAKAEFVELKQRLAKSGISKTVSVVS